MGELDEIPSRIENKAVSGLFPHPSRFFLPGRVSASAAPALASLGRQWGESVPAAGRLWARGAGGGLEPGGANGAWTLGGPIWTLALTGPWTNVTRDGLFHGPDAICADQIAIPDGGCIRTIAARPHPRLNPFPLRHGH
jgi:hypothetical protein